MAPVCTLHNPVSCPTEVFPYEHFHCVRFVPCSPEKWKEGSSNTVESGGRKVNSNKALEKKTK
jgi:hypothetical protein